MQNAPVGPKIRNCRAEHLGDDAITITSRYYPIYKIDERKGEIWVMSRERPVFGKGDSLVFLKNGGKIMGNSKCADMDGTDISQDEVDDCAKLFKRELIMQNRFKYGTRVKISPWIKGLEEGDIFNSVDRSGRGFVIENNFAGHTRARGIFVKASDGVIKNNAVEGCELAGIVLAQEVYYMSGGCFANVEISSNRVKDCLFGRTNASYTQAGAISVVAIDGQWQIADMGASKNIIVKNNTVEGCPLPCMLFTSIDGLTLKDNIIKPDFDMVRNWGSAVGIENSSEVFMKNVKLAE